MKINIVLSADRKYCKLLATTIISILENNKEVVNLTVFCLLFNPGDDYVNNIKRIGIQYGREIHIIETSTICENMRFWEHDEDGRYIRLLLTELLPTVDVVLYLDCDIIVRKSLVSLFNIDISDYYHAAVLDTARMNARLESNINNPDSYFNSGVMLINLKKWRECNIVESFKNFKHSNSNKGIYRDQRVLNGTTALNYFPLPPEYNFMPEFYQYNVQQLQQISGVHEYYSQKEIDKAKQDPVIVHFSGRSIDRPWYRNSKHPFTDEYRYYMSKTVFTNFPLWKDSWKNVLLWKIKKYIPFDILKLIILIKNRKQ